MSKISYFMTSEGKYIAEYENSVNNFSEESITCCLRNLNLDAYGYISISSTFWGKKTLKKKNLSFSIKIIDSLDYCSPNKIVIQCNDNNFVEYIFNTPQLFDVNTYSVKLNKNNQYPVKRILQHC